MALLSLGHSDLNISMRPYNSFVQHGPRNLPTTPITDFDSGGRPCDLRSCGLSVGLWKIHLGKLVCGVGFDISVLLLAETEGWPRRGAS
jgi:hypothetical protein